MLVTSDGFNESRFYPYGLNRKRYGFSWHARIFHISLIFWGFAVEKRHCRLDVHWDELYVRKWCTLGKTEVCTFWFVSWCGRPREAPEDAECAVNLVLKVEELFIRKHRYCRNLSVQGVTYLRISRNTYQTVFYFFKKKINWDTYGIPAW